MNLRFLTTYEGTTLELLVWSVFLGLCIAVFVSVYQKRVPGALVRKLLEVGADSPQNAVTLTDIGMQNRFWIRHILWWKENSVRRVVRTAEYEVCQPDASDAAPNLSDAERKKAKIKQKQEIPRLPVSVQHLYIPADCQEQARSLYREKGAGLGVAIAAVILFFILALLSLFFAEELLTMVKNFTKHYFGS